MKLIILKPLRITVGSHTQNLNGTGTITIPAWAIVAAEDSRGDSCNVWITYEGTRGKIECGEIRNLLKDGRAKPVAINEFSQ